MTIFGFAGKHMKTIHHPPHCDLPIFNGDESPAPKLEKVKKCPTCSYVRPKAHFRCSKLQAVQPSEGENGKSSNAIAMVTVPINNVGNDEVDSFASVNPQSCVADTSDDDASCDGSPSPSNDRMSAEELAKAVAKHKTQLENILQQVLSSPSLTKIKNL